MLARSSRFLDSVPRAWINTNIQRDFRLATVELKEKSSTTKQVAPTKPTDKRIKVKSTTLKKSASSAAASILAPSQSAFDAPFATKCRCPKCLETQFATSKSPTSVKSVSAPNPESLSTVKTSSSSKEVQRIITPVTSVKSAEVITSATLDKINIPVNPAPLTKLAVSVAESLENSQLIPRKFPTILEPAITTTAPSVDSEGIPLKPAPPTTLAVSVDAEVKFPTTLEPAITITDPPVDSEGIAEPEVTNEPKAIEETAVSTETQSPSAQKSFEDPSSASAAKTQAPFLSEKETALVESETPGQVQVEGPAIDPIQKIFADKVKEYATKKEGVGGKLVEASKKVEDSLQEELDKIAQSYGGGEGVEMTAFPTFEFKDPKIDTVDLICDENF